jgi:hypothetical protein
MRVEDWNVKGKTYKQSDIIDRVSARMLYPPQTTKNMVRWNGGDYETLHHHRVLERPLNIPTSMLRHPSTIPKLVIRQAA